MSERARGDVAHAPRQGWLGKLPYVAVAAVLALSLASLGAAGLARRGGSGAATIDGIPCEAAEQTAYHVHAYLVLLDRGRTVPIPAGIGIVHPDDPSPDGFIDGGTCLFWLHTHDGTGTIHVEAPTARPFTLGQFFDVWGQPLARDDVYGHRGRVSVTVNGQPFAGDPRSIVLHDGDQITIRIS